MIVYATAKYVGAEGNPFYPHGHEITIAIHTRRFSPKVDVCRVHGYEYKPYQDSYVIYPSAAHLLMDFDGLSVKMDVEAD